MIHRAAPFLEELVRWDIIGAELRDGMLAVRIAHDVRMSPEAQRRLAANEPLSIRDKINIWLQAQVAVGGPKVFQPTLDQCLAMEQVAPRIAINDYAQPYPVMVIDLPEKYRQARACSFGSAAGVSTHAPACLLVGAHGSPPWTIWVGLVLDSGVGVQWALMPSDATIEDGIVREFGQDSYLPADLPANRIGSEERSVMAGLLRLSVNAMLLLADYGCKHLGPLNKSHYRRLEHHHDLARKRKMGVADAQRNLRMAPQLYGFPQDIVLHSEERTTAADSTSGGSGETDAHRRPHWRRGHWKMQAFGAGLSQHKRLFIKPVLVNRHLLRDGGIPQTNYRPST